MNKLQLHHYIYLIVLGIAIFDLTCTEGKVYILCFVATMWFLCRLSFELFVEEKIK